MWMTALMAATAFAGVGTPVLAAAGTNYGTTIEGTKTTTFDKFLVMDKQANVPNAKFTYTVTAGNAKAYDVAGKKFQVLAGVDADKITMAGVGGTAEAAAAANSIVFRQGDGSDGAHEGKDQYVKDLDTTKQKYAMKTATLDFSAVQFTEPGVYRYIITESGTNQGITNDADLTRVLDVYVNDASADVDGAFTKKLTIAGYVLHSNENDEPDVAAGADFGSTGAYTDKKSQGFTNSYDTSDLTLRKQVTGNQASRDKYFEFTLNIDKLSRIQNTTLLLMTQTLHPKQMQLQLVQMLDRQTLHLLQQTALEKQHRNSICSMDSRLQFRVLQKIQHTL